MSLADTSDRQGTASADRFIKWHFLQLGLRKEEKKRKKKEMRGWALSNVQVYRGPRVLV